MNLFFNIKAGKTIDFLYSIYFIFNNNYEEFFTNVDANPNKTVFKAVERLSKKVDINNKKVHLLLEKNTLLAESLIDYEKILHMESSKDFIDYLKTLDKDYIIQCILKDLLDNNKADENHNNGKPLTKNEINKLINDNKSLLNFINNSNLNQDLKWQLMMFLNYTDEHMKEIINILENYSEHFEAFMDKNKVFNKFVQELEKKINEKGIDYLYDISNNGINFKDYSQLYISPMFFNSCSLVPHKIEDKACVLLGIDFEKTMKKLGGTNEFEKKINIFNCLSDKTRFKLLELIAKERLFSKELALKAGISVGTVTYHMNFLLSANLVTIQKEGQKTYYTFNREVLKSACDFLNQNFKL
ncbi:hypothetical protein SH2C18_50280 [Clostridium sediminicola]|uniref:ArsR/SmtB family transcription factor n=1 Tax=Clostridium sediminicola TaxID=3114879 RepID=UPI0031F23945